MFKMFSRKTDEFEPTNGGLADCQSYEFVTVKKGWKEEGFWPIRIALETLDTKLRAGEYFLRGCFGGGLSVGL